MVQRDSINQDSDHEEKPVYLGKSVAVLCYCLFAGFGFAAVSLAWLAIRAHYHGNSSLFSSPLEQTVFLGFMSVSCLVFAIVFFLMPSLQAQFPKLRFENRYSLEAMEAQHHRSIRYSRKHRKIVVRHAPKSIQLAVRFFTWTPAVLFVLLIVSTVISQLPISPAWLSIFYSNFNSLIPAPMIGFLFFGCILLFDIPNQLLIRHARHLYDRHLRRLETNAEHCPGCDFPIDQERRPESCPECGVAYPV